MCIRDRISAAQISAHQGCTAKIHPPEISAIEKCTTQSCARANGACATRVKALREPCCAVIAGKAQTGTFQIALLKIGASKVNPAQIGPPQVD